MGIENLNVLAIGDSLFSGTGWDENNKYCPITQQWISLLAQEYSWHFSNLGIAGQTISFSADLNFKNNYSTKSIYQAICNEQFYDFGTPLNYKVGNPSQNTSRNVDIILLEGGCNDFGQGVPYVASKTVKINNVNTKVEDLDAGPGYFKSACKLVIDYLLVKYPKAKICWITPWYNDSPNYTKGDTSYTMTHAVTGESISRTNYYKAPVELKKEVYAENDRVGYINLGDSNICGFDILSNKYLNGQKIAYDNFHLTPFGMETIAKIMGSCIEEIATNGFNDEGTVSLNKLSIEFEYYPVGLNESALMYGTWDVSVYGSTICLQSFYEKCIVPASPLESVTFEDLKNDGYVWETESGESLQAFDLLSDQASIKLYKTGPSADSADYAMYNNEFLRYNNENVIII